jgi:hypothetical protein
VSTARLLLDDEVLCVGAVETVALPRELTGAGFGAARSMNDMFSPHPTTQGRRDRRLPAA